MKIFRTEIGALIQRVDKFVLIKNVNWDEFINDDNLFLKCQSYCIAEEAEASGQMILNSYLQKPIVNQEIWASGVTYYNSKMARQEESEDSGGADFYAKVYSAERPELFFKSTGHRTVGHKEGVAIRKDSTWNVPEPELTLCITSSGKIVGYTIGNDMSSRSIEGENPLYLPQAKTYDKSASLGPGIFVTDKALSNQTEIRITIDREGLTVFQGQIKIDQIKRKFEDLVEYLFRESSFPFGCFLMTGTGIIPGSEFTLARNDKIKIAIDQIGTLENFVL